LLRDTADDDADADDADDAADAADIDDINFTLDDLTPDKQDEIITKINTETKKGKTTFKNYISTLDNDKLHCFITRNGESALKATVVVGASLIGVGLLELMQLLNRVCNIRYRNYLYKFEKNGEYFFITFKKRIKKGREDKFSDFGITLSKHVDNPNDCKSVVLQYTHDKQIVNGTVDVLGNMNGIRKVSLKNEYKSDVHNDSTDNNMIVLESCETDGDTLKTRIDLIEEINSAIALIRKIDYEHFLDEATPTPSGAGAGVGTVPSITKTGPMTDDKFREWLTTNQERIYNDPNWNGGGLPPENTGSTRKNKYMYRITSRKRRLYRKKSRKGKNAYKKLRSRKIARK
jgi:hypothetical protein